MPQRRNNHHNGAAFGPMLGAFHQEHYHLDPDMIENHDANFTRCCVPTECLLEDAIIRLEDLRDVVKVTCNNDHCNQGQYMHRECFETWEQSVLQYLKSCGRARSWSERQRHQNLWTKKGYDLAFKACGCRCGRGHLKKDLDWLPPRTIGRILFDNDDGKKKKRKHRQNTRPALAVSAPIGHHHPNSNGGAKANVATAGNDQLLSHEVRGRAGSLSSSTGSGSPPASSDHGASPTHVSDGTKKKTRDVDFFSDRSR
ncbi:hypothetical protein B566_EDAN012815 [Ephemera danica]|nr:hypothetical protein B566_EDAN012815 [Ephemera danica]